MRIRETGNGALSGPDKLYRELCLAGVATTARLILASSKLSPARSCERPKVCLPEDSTHRSPGSCGVLRPKVGRHQTCSREGVRFDLKLVTEGDLVF